MNSMDKKAYEKPEIKIHGNIKTITKDDKAGKYDDGAMPSSNF